MAISIIMGLPGAGKTYIALHRFIVDVLQNSKRPIYTNLPFDGPELERFLVRLTRSVEKRRHYRSRIHFLPNADQEIRACRVEFVMPKREGERVVCKRLDWPKDVEKMRLAGKEIPEDEGRDMLREGYLFALPNSVTLLDEVADIYNTQDRGRRPQELLSYINHHRHYKDDLYFFIQDPREIDPGIRRKVEFCYVVSNSLKTNLVEWWALRGLRWPVQFFRVRMILGSKMGRGDPFSVSERDPDESFTVWPTQAGFRCYRSFSKSAKIAGKETAAEDAESGDLQRGIWPKIRHWLGMSTGALAVFGGGAIGVWMCVRVIFGLAGVSSEDVAGLSGRPAKSAASVQTNALHAAGVAQTSAAAPGEPPERVVLVTPGVVVTSKGKYRVGSLLGSNRVERVLLDGFVFAGGRRVAFAAAFAPELAPGPGSDAR